MQTERKNRKLLVAVLIVACIVIAVQLVVIFGLLNREKTAETVTLEPSGDIVINVVETPVADLKCDTAPVNKIFARIEKDGVSFFVAVDANPEVKLFTIYFDGSKGTPLGTVEGKDGKSVDISVENGNYEDATGLSASEIESLNRTREDLLDNILANLNFTDLSSTATSDDDNSVVVETPYADLQYKTDYPEYLTIRLDDGDTYEMSFYCTMPEKNEVKLFTCVFGREEGILVGHINNVPVSLVEAEVDLDDTWSEEDCAVCYTMQEEMGRITEELMKIKGFTLEN